MRSALVQEGLEYMNLESVHMDLHYGRPSESVLRLVLPVTRGNGGPSILHEACRDDTDLPSYTCTF